MSRFIVTADWDSNAPHLSEAAKKDLWNSIPIYQRDARTKGIPQLGAGVIYPIPDEEIICDPFEIPRHWPRGYGLDVGWNRTAAIFKCKNPDTGIGYFYDEYYRGETDPEIHAAALRRRASLNAKAPWIPGRIDPAARGRSQADGEQLLKMYRELIYGQDPGVGSQLLRDATNAVESGIYDVLMALSQGMLKVMKGRCPNWLAERRLYRRDERGRVIKKNDHAQDAGRYVHASGDAWLLATPVDLPVDPIARFGSGGHSNDGLGWMRM